MVNKMKPDCFCKKKESEKISADKIYPSLYPYSLASRERESLVENFIFCFLKLFYLRSFIFFTFHFYTLYLQFYIFTPLSAVFKLEHPSGHKLPLVMIKWTGNLRKRDKIMRDRMMLHIIILPSANIKYNNKFKSESIFFKLSDRLSA